MQDIFFFFQTVHTKKKIDLFDVEKFFFQTERNTMIETQLDKFFVDNRKENIDYDFISKLPTFLDSLCFDKFCIKYTKEQIITLISYLQSIYPQIYLNNNQLLDYKNQQKQPTEYLCMNCGEKCTKNLNHLLYISSHKRKHDYSFLLTDPKKILPSLCCNLCNRIISKTNDNVLFKDTRYVDIERAIHLRGTECWQSERL